MAKTRRKSTKCPNCAYTFNDANNYCPNCGQENHDLNIPVKHLIWEFLEGTLHYDTKALRTIKYLLFRPGKLTHEFIIGRRASYVPPFRLYVFVSLVFFSVLALNSTTEVNKSDTPSSVAVTAPITAADSLLNTSNVPLRASLLPASDTTTKQSEYIVSFISKAKKFGDGGEKSMEKVRKNISLGMFILMPLLAYLLYLFYYRQRRNYVEHLMFAVHLNTFFFLVIMVVILVNMALPALDLDTVAFFIMMLYFYLALKKVYNQTYKRTFYKLIPIAFLYCLSLIVMLTGAFAISVAMS